MSRNRLVPYLSNCLNLCLCLSLSAAHTALGPTFLTYPVEPRHLLSSLSAGSDLTCCTHIASSPLKSATTYGDFHLLTPCFSSSFAANLRASTVLAVSSSLLSLSLERTPIMFLSCHCTLKVEMIEFDKVNRYFSSHRGPPYSYIQGSILALILLI